VCFYSGHIHSFRSIKHLQDKRYLILVEGNVLVDPGPLPNVKARYINDPVDPRFVNCEYVPQSRKFRSAVVATREILPNEELFCSYGDAYWAMQDMSGRVKT